MTAPRDPSLRDWRLPMAMLVGVAIVALFVIDRSGDSDLETSPPETTASPASPATQAALGSNGITDMARASVQGKYARDQLIAENPSAYFDPDRTDSDYLRNVRRHNQIGQWLTSSRKDDPAYRELMRVLLENGYGIEEWGEAVSILGFHHLPVVIQRHALMEAGFSPQQIEDELAGARREQAHQLPMVRENLAWRCGVSDDALVDRLLAIELEFLPNEDVLGLGPLRTIRGDKLHTDSDWLVDEFATAQASYDGPPRRRPEQGEGIGDGPPSVAGAASGVLPIRDDPPEPSAP